MLQQQMEGRQETFLPHQIMIGDPDLNPDEPTQRAQKAELSSPGVISEPLLAVESSSLPPEVQERLQVAEVSKKTRLAGLRQGLNRLLGRIVRISELWQMATEAKPAFSDQDLHYIAAAQLYWSEDLMKDKNNDPNKFSSLHMIPEVNRGGQLLARIKPGVKVFSPAEQQKIDSAKEALATAHKYVEGNLNSLRAVSKKIDREQKLTDAEKNLSNLLQNDKNVALAYKRLNLKAKNAESLQYRADLQQWALKRVEHLKQMDGPGKIMVKMAEAILENKLNVHQVANAIKQYGLKISVSELGDRKLTPDWYEDETHPLFAALQSLDPASEQPGKLLDSINQAVSILRRQAN